MEGTLAPPAIGGRHCGGTVTSVSEPEELGLVLCDSGSCPLHMNLLSFVNSSHLSAES